MAFSTMIRSAANRELRIALLLPCRVPHADVDIATRRFRPTHRGYFSPAGTDAFLKNEISIAALAHALSSFIISCDSGRVQPRWLSAKPYRFSQLPVWA